MKRLFFIFSIIFSLHAIANETEEKTRKLFEIQGVINTYQEVIDQSRAQAKENAKQAMNQILTQLNPPKEFQDRILLVTEKYAKALATERTAEQIVEVIVQYYSTRFSEQELDELIAFYSSDLGKKDAFVSKGSYNYLKQYYKDENDRIRISATNDFIKDLQLIAIECNCTKNQTNKKKK